MLARFRLNADPSISGALDSMYVELSVRLKNGTRLYARCDAPLGSWNRPVDNDVVREKSRGLLVGAVGERRADQLIDQVERKDAPLAVRDLMACLA
jgi:aconitate decarboxylase